MLDVLKEAPSPNSPLETICIAVFQRRQRVRYLETLISIAANAEDAARQKLLDDYFAELFPYSKGEKWKTNNNIEERLRREYEKGPMLVQSELPSKKR
jgi:hypothetical protein